MVSTAAAASPTLTYLYPAGTQRGTTAEITASGTFDKWPVDIWVSGKGVSVEAAKDKGKLKVTVAKDAVLGTYWLRAHNAEGASELRPFIVGVLPEIAEKETNDDYRNAHAIEGSSAVVNGKLRKSGDVDCFAVELQKGDTLVASLEAHNTLRSPIDAMMQIVSADGFVLAENNDFHGLDPLIAYTAKHDGTHTVRIYAFPAQPTSSIRHFGSEESVYRLTLTTGPFADYAMPLAVSNDEKQKVEVRGWNIPPELETLPVSSGVVFSNEMANPLRVRVEPHATFGPKLTEPLQPPFSVTGLIEKPGSEAEFRFTAKKGQSLTLEVESRKLGLVVNPVVRVLDANAKELSRTESRQPSEDVTVAFKLPADGVYTVAVSDLFGGGSPRHAFLLRVLSEPEYELSMTADRFTAKVGKPATITLKLDRLRGFGKDVKIVTEGLPAGAKLIETKPKKPDPKTITLSLTTDKPISTSFRLFGEVEGEPQLRREVRFALPNFETTTSDLWLTVQP